MSENAIKVSVVGGGAAGMTCAYFLAKEGANVTLFEHGPRLGKKLSITGKGRCNLTNECTLDTFLANMTKNPKFMYRAFSRFGPRDVMALFESFGVPLKTERGMRVFPVSDKAGDIVDALKKALRDVGVRVVYESVTSLMIENGRVAGVRADKGEYKSGAVVLCTGGKSYPQTGSDGSGYALAKQAGHTVTPLLPSLVPLETEETWPKELMGLSLKNTAIKITENVSGKKVYDDFGEMLFTHFGVSGPMILSASAHLREMGKKRFTLHIDLKPALDEKTLDKRLLAEFSGRENKNFSNTLSGLLPSKLIPVFIKLSGIAPERKVNTLTKEERARLVRLFKDMTLGIKGFRPISEAVVTSGGIDVREVDPANMQSKICKGLFFAGEILDLDAYTGGFNLQIAFSTAYSAAQGALGATAVAQL